MGLAFRIFQIIITLTILILVIVNYYKKKNKISGNSFIRNLKQKPSIQLLSYFKKSFKPLYLETNTTLIKEEIIKLKSQKINAGKLNIIAEIEEVRIIGESVLIFITSESYGLIVLIDYNQKEFFKESKGTVNDIDITRHILQELVLKLKLNFRKST
jgi:hypothetical protein